MSEEYIIETEDLTRIYGNGDEVRALAVPSLIVHGALSHLYSDEASEWMERNIPNSRRVVFTNSGHAPHLEEPDRFNEEIRIFAADISNRQTAQKSKPQQSN